MKTLKILVILILVFIFQSCEKMNFGWWRETECHCVETTTGKKHFIILKNVEEESCAEYSEKYGYECVKGTPLPANSGK